MQLSPHFSLDEFTDTTHRNIDNTLPASLMNNAIETCEMLERIRFYLSKLAGRDIQVNLSSGYRCRELNAVVGGSANSDHLQALSADWTARTFGTPYQVCQALAARANELKIGQIIHEYGRWIHTGAREPAKLVNRIITIDKYEGKVRTRVGIQQV